MKHCSAFTMLLLALVSGPTAVHAAQLLVSQTPVTRVVGLLTELEAKIQSDGKLEGESYDKYACWCENTLGRKANDISTGKEQIEDLETLIKKLKAEIATHGAEIGQLKGDIAGNVESQREATEVREKGNMDFEEEKTESEQCIGALEAAIKVLTGAGTGKKGFLETLQEAQVLSVTAGLRRVLHQGLVTRAFSDKEIQMVKHFVERPDAFVGGRAGGLSAMQIAQNPFGDYAPQSTQIQGILRGMYDAFTADLEKANAEESDSQKSFEELMATKKKELNTLQVTLEKQNYDKASKSKKLSDSQLLLDDTKAQLEADEQFFANTKDSCKVKASEWAQRVQLRTEELAGMGRAIQLLTSSEASKIFENATTTFLQLASGTRRNAVTRSGRDQAFAKLRTLAGRYRTLDLVQLAAQVKTAGHFDEVITSIDSMIALLRKEEQADIEHRDRCEGAINKNKNDMEDLNHDIDKAKKALDRMNDEKIQLTGKVKELGDEIEGTKSGMEFMLKMRNEERASFEQALKDDNDAVELLGRAIIFLSEFYKRNGIELSLMAKGKREPEYTVDPDKAPETVWDGGNYGGLKEQSGGIIAIISMIKEDLEKEMLTGRADDAKAQTDYEKDRAAMKEMLDSQIASKMATEKELAELEAKILDMTSHKDQKGLDLDSEEGLETDIYSDCSWIDTHFDTRREKRKTEIEGLVDAKHYLAGVESGDELAP